MNRKAPAGEVLREKTITARVTAELKAAVAKAARAEDRTVSHFVELALTAALATKKAKKA